MKINQDPNKVTGITVLNLLGWIGLFTGAILLISAFFIDRMSMAFSIFIGLGVALFPAGMFTLIADYNLSRLLTIRIQEILNEVSYDLKSSIGNLNKTNLFLEESQDMGLVRVYSDRASSLNKFFDHAFRYVNEVSPSDVEQGTKSVVVVGSSLKGIWDNPHFAGKLTKLIENGKKVNCSFSFLLTHPHYSRYREGQESREKDDIAKEILHAISWLSGRGIGREHVKLYKGTPTCFLIATTERMLINPYPYQVEAYRCFCLEVVPTNSTNSIYNSYWVNHFEKPWEGEIHGEDHRLVINALSYQYYTLEGPIPSGHIASKNSPLALADVVVIQDSGECYISLNISRLPAQLPYDRDESGLHEILELDSDFNIALLNPKSGEWETIGAIELNERRRGFWHSMRPQMHLSAYLQIGVFPKGAEGPFSYPDDALECLKGTCIPVLWQDLQRPQSPAADSLEALDPEKEERLGVTS